jgi:stage III sporulation protein AE
MRKVGIVLLLSLVLFVTPAHASPQDSSDRTESFEELVTDQLNDLDTNNWEPFLKYIQDQGTDLFGGESAKDIINNLLTGQFSFSWEDILDSLSRSFFKEFRLNLLLMAKIIVLAVLCSIFRNMNDSFNNPSVGEIGYFACYSIVVILIIQSLISILAVGSTGIEQMSGFMQILLPALLALLTAMGSFATSSVMQPAVGVLVGMVGTVLKNIMLPLLTLSAVVTLVNYISERVQIQKLGKLLNNLCTWTLTFIFTIFIGVLTIQGAMTSSFDGISYRTARFALDTFVPIVGKMFSQSVDTIIGCSLLLKNAVGVTGLIIIGLLSLSPGMKILSLMLLYKLSGALLEPITDKRISDCLNGIGSVMNVLFITVMGIALMFFLTIALIIGTGNASVMLR